MLLIVFSYEKARETVEEETSVKRGFQKDYRHINKICGGFINIRERIRIMWFTKRH